MTSFRWPARSVARALHLYRSGHGYRPYFFRPYFHYNLSSVHYCEDRYHIHFFIRSSHIWFSYIHSILNGLQLSDNGIVMYCAFSGHPNFTTNRSSLLGLFTVSFLLPVCVRFCRWVLFLLKFDSATIADVFGVLNKKNCWVVGATELIMLIGHRKESLWSWRFEP